MDKQLYSTNDPSTSYTSMVNFGLVTPEIEVWEICTLETIRQKAVISQNISTTTEPNFTIVSALVDVYMEFTKLTYVSR